MADEVTKKASFLEVSETDHEGLLRDFFYARSKETKLTS